MKIAFYVDSVPFTRGVISGAESLGGSESACLGLARALQARGHQVHILATKLDADCVGVDHAGVAWHPAEITYDLSQVVEWDVFCSLRMPYVFQRPIKAKLRLLWNQDLLLDQAKLAVMAVAWAYDAVVYVSEYHRKQWEGLLPELQPLGWVTRNGFDPSLVPADAVKVANRIIHISRPERGLRPLLAMWPALKQRVPDAQLQICRYNSMYDAGGWGQVCASYDAEVARVNAEVGGITYLGELGKPALYQAIAEAAVMWYPGVVDFAETSCVAAIEAQACGTPFVGSFKGALPETVTNGLLTRGDADTAEYQASSVDSVAFMLDACGHSTAYRSFQAGGRRHVQSYTYDAIAAEWEAWLGESFAKRPGLGVLRQLMHHDDHTAAAQSAQRVIEAQDQTRYEGALKEAHEAAARCANVIAGREQTAEIYAERAIADPLAEWDINLRFHEVAPWFADSARVLDVACGNGSFAIGLATVHPHLTVVGLDYAEGNIARARAAAVVAGVQDRVTFFCRPVWDFATGRMAAGWRDHAGGLLSDFDAIFCGEFLEHVADAPALVDGIEAAAAPGAMVVYTVPNGPFSEMRDRQLPDLRSHVHHFTQDDLTDVFGAKSGLTATYLHLGQTVRGHQVGHWLVRYQAGKGHARARDIDARLLTTRPKVALSAMLIMRDAEADLARCLDSICGVVDEIVIGDTGSTDESKAIAAKYGARVVDIPSVQDDPDGFAGARNRVLAATTGDWCLWIDTDEVLVGGEHLWKYLEGGAYNGYAIRQNHLMLDAPMGTDKPVRLFRKTTSVRFYGCIHEQPQDGDANTDITPALEIGDVQIAHTGYLHEGVRRWKMRERNLPLLIRDQQRFPERRLGRLLVLRDLVNLGDYAREQAGGALTAEAKRYYAQAIGLFEQHLGDPANKLYALARPFYEAALRNVATAMEFEIAIAGRQQGLGASHAKPERIWVRDLADVERVLAHRMQAIKDQVQPKPIDVEPIGQPRGVAA